MGVECHWARLPIKTGSKEQTLLLDESSTSGHQAFHLRLNRREVFLNSNRSYFIWSLVGVRDSSCLMAR